MLNFIQGIQYNFIEVVFIFIVLDVLTGIASAFKTGTFKSSVMREGGFHKLMLFMAIAFGVCLDFAQSLVNVQTLLGFELPCLETICIYITFMELLSIIENFNKSYPGILPKVLTDKLYEAAKTQGVEASDTEEKG